MTTRRGSKLFRGGIQTNLDKRLTVSQVQKAERGERNQALIADRYKRAARAEREQGIEAPDVIYEGFQEQGHYTYDPKLDASRAVIHARTYLPVKEVVIRTDGSVVKTFGPAALECIQEGLFCSRCLQKQPEDKVRQREAFSRMREVAISVIGQRPSDQCCYCGALLGLQGDDEGPSSDVTPEQREMAGIV